jgi:hypothetical protein
MLQERAPGGAILDDLLALNPIRVAAADDTAVGTAASALAAEAPATDARLQQKVIVQATGLRIADLLERLTRATGVSLMARMEVADEKVSLWAADRRLMEVMQDLRHLHGYYWSRYGAAGKHTYALWQDAQSRAQEEAELQQWVVDQQRAFAERIERAVRMLNAGDRELKPLAQQDPYSIVQIKHPVLRSAYRLFAALAPDQQAQLTRGQTPSRGIAAGHLLEVSLLDSSPNDRYWTPRSSLASWAPRGDMVTLKAAEMTPAQRAAVAAIVREAAAQWERDATRARGLPALDQEQRHAYQISQARTLAAADLQTAAVTLFRCGDPGWQTLSVRVEVQSGVRSWMVHSTIGLSSEAREFYNRQLHRGEFDLWPPGQAEVDRLLGHDSRRAAKVPGATEPTSAPPQPDPILDAPVSLAWPLPARELERSLNSGEILAALHRDIRRPLVVDTTRVHISQLLSCPAEFRAERRPLREILQQVAPGVEYRTYGGAIFISDPQRLRGRLNALPRSVEALLQARTGPFTLDDMALLARSLSPWQITKLGDYLPRRAIDQLIAAQELLKLYGELAPAQRSALTQGLPFSALTPPQQQWFLACAQRQRPSMEPWRFQHGGLRLLTETAPSTDYDGLQGPARPVARMVFQVSFPEDGPQSLPIDLFPQKTRRGINSSPSEWVGKRFPFLSHSPIRGSWKAALADERLRKKAMVLILSRPFVDPYVGLQPPPATDPWVRTLAERLRDTSVTVVHVRVPGWDTTPPLRDEPDLPHLIQLRDDGESNGQPVDASGDGRWIAQWPTVLVVGSDEIVQAVFEGQEVCSVDAIERAARQLH